MTTTTTETQTATQLPRWTIDAAHTHVGFGVRHMMISTVRGEFSELSGEVLLDPKAPESGKIKASIEVASINTRNEDRDKHLKSADFFDAENHPHITFESKAIRRQGDGLEIVGDLTIRGTTREVTLKVDELTAEHGDPWGNRRIGASAKTSISRSDFGMTWNSALEAGGVLVGDEVKIALEVELIKQA